LLGVNPGQTSFEFNEVVVHETQEQGHTIEGRFLKTVMKIKISCLAGKSMDNERSNACLFGNGNGSENRIL
jgi:hypothetical protein